jgi:mRNA-degrading endonuclease RelE of RelBE toxin-antitoxin system
MSYNILYIPPFERQLKRLSKKYPSLKDDFAKFLETLEVNPLQGKALGNNCYKIRMTINSKNMGKRGGARIITYLVLNENIVYLLSIYDKSQKDTILDKELEYLLKYIN